MKVLITGASGFVGSYLMQHIAGAVAAPSVRNADTEFIKRLVDDADIVIHTAAISDIGSCEKDPDASYKANVLLPMEIAKACKDRKLICFSTDQVYSASPDLGPYKEGDECPANIYAKHKLEMEKRVLDIAPNALMLRAEWMYNSSSKKMNFYRILMESENDVSFNIDQYRGVTYVKEVAEAMPAVFMLPGGVYNFGSETCDSIGKIAADFIKFAKRPIKVTDSPARHNLWMDCSLARSFAVTFSDVAKGLERCYKDSVL